MTLLAKSMIFSYTKLHSDYTHRNSLMIKFTIFAFELLRMMHLGLSVIKFCTSSQNRRTNQKSCGLNCACRQLRLNGTMNGTEPVHIKTSETHPNWPAKNLRACFCARLEDGGPDQYFLYTRTNTHKKHGGKVIIDSW